MQPVPETAPGEAAMLPCVPGVGVECRSGECRGGGGEVDCESTGGSSSGWNRDQHALWCC